MTICKFFAQGSCRFGNKCWYEHPSGANAGPQRQLNFSNFGNTNTGQAGAFQSNPRQGGQQQQQQQQSNKYKWTAPHLSSFGGNDQASQNQQQQQLMSPQEIISGLSREITTWESSKMWLLSCVSFQKSGPSIPGMTDMSPEELRFEAYEAQKNENTQEYILKIQQMQNDYSAKRQELKSPSNQLRDKLIEFIETSRKQQAITSGNSASRFSSSAGSAFGSSGVIGQGGGGGFGAGASKVFGGASSNLFGKSEPAAAAAANPFTGQASAFGGSSSGSAFGFQPTQAQPAGSNVFGNSGGTSAFGGGGGQLGSGAASVFGNALNQGFGGSQPVGQGASAFGAQGATPTPQGGAFGASTSVFGGSSMTSGASPAAGLFGKPAAPASGFGQPSVFGSGMGAPAAAGSVFGAAGGSVFGQPAAIISEISATMYTPMASLTPAELEQYQAQKFTLGKIPTRPPPKELCF